MDALFPGAVEDHGLAVLEVVSGIAATLVVHPAMNTANYAARLLEP